MGVIEPNSVHRQFHLIGPRSRSCTYVPWPIESLKQQYVALPGTASNFDYVLLSPTPSRCRPAIATSWPGSWTRLPEAVIVVDASDRVVAVNAPALTLFPALRPDLLLARGLRAPDVLDAIMRARASGHAERATWLDRVPVERFFELHVAAMEGPRAPRP